MGTRCSFLLLAAVLLGIATVGLQAAPPRSEEWRNSLKPERQEAGRTLARSLAAGYPLLTLSMILGMIWAHMAWGRIWGWDLKEVWTLIAWLVCTLTYHLRGRTRWQGRGLAWLALLALGAVLFTFLGVGWLARAVGLESLHLF